MLFTGEFIDAPVALDWGLVNRVAPAERLMETAHELANNLKGKPREPWRWARPCSTGSWRRT
jgi:enoyl-CoA hydratase/carnithine racemase